MIKFKNIVLGAVAAGVLGLLSGSVVAAEQGNTNTGLYHGVKGVKRSAVGTVYSGIGDQLIEAAQGLPDLGSGIYPTVFTSELSAQAEAAVTAALIKKDQVSNLQSQQVINSGLGTKGNLDVRGGVCPYNNHDYGDIIQSYMDKTPEIATMCPYLYLNKEGWVSIGMISFGPFFGAGASEQGVEANWDKYLEEFLKMEYVDKSTGKPVSASVQEQDLRAIFAKEGEKNTLSCENEQWAEQAHGYVTPEAKVTSMKRNLCHDHIKTLVDTYKKDKQVFASFSKPCQELNLSLSSRFGSQVYAGTDWHAYRDALVAKDYTAAVQELEKKSFCADKTDERCEVLKKYTKMCTNS